MTIENSIPVIDVGALFGSDRSAVDALAREFYQVYSTVGFSYVVNQSGVCLKRPASFMPCQLKRN